MNEDEMRQGHIYILNYSNGNRQDKEYVFRKQSRFYQRDLI